MTAYALIALGLSSIPRGALRNMRINSFIAFLILQCNHALDFFAPGYRQFVDVVSCEIWVSPVK